MYALKHPFTHRLEIDTFPIQAMVKHSHEKDRFLKVATKQMQEAQAFVDEL
jgi:hypothetical protein